MQVLFEEDGGFKAGAVLDAHGADATNYQVEMASGRRVKIKAANVVLKFDAPPADELLPAAQAMADEIDLDFLWEVAPQDEFDVAALGAEYFGGKLSPVQFAALLLRVHTAPMYFRRKGKGRYRPAPENELKAALASQEKKRIAAEKQAELARELIEGRLPPGWAAEPGQDPALARAAFLLFKPDKNGMEWKALDAAAHDSHQQPEKLLLKAGAFASVKDLHRGRFLVEWFPRGTGFGNFELPTAAVDAAASLPVADVQAFSIDDSQTTEIDDALSVQWLAGGTVRVGVHIAAPGLAIRPGDALDAIARKRLSTVYTPGEKITMLPDALVQVFTLGEGTARPALSIYGDFDPESGECLATRTVVERVPIAANLRHDQLDALITEQTLVDDDTEFPFKRELRMLARLGDRLASDREQIRGKPEPRNRTDFNFRVVVGDDGAERIVIDQRKRDAPLDRIVAEWMIFANSNWGRLLDEAGVPGIYRVQTHWARPGARQSAVRMQTHAAQHIGIGVKHYAWSSSPLRRYVDLVNQWQILAVARGEPVPFPKNSAELFAIIGAFDAAYAAYASVQSALERYWCLRWLAQEGCIGGGKRLDAVVLRNENVRLAALPLVLSLAGIGHLPPGTRVEVDVIAVDEAALTVEGRLAAVHEEAAPADVEALEDDLPDSTDAVAEEAEGEAAVVGAAPAADADAGDGEVPAAATPATADDAPAGTV
ncbi:RNB domain-containing ribonuclease [Derxia lacustris]|uniref:RNB domain-containing ribonuclease n=1 Tax=Derxia lacustris TaxID=764842 RepID=UPI000A1711CB|nr:RNB domain-containing ribonuclease [Derxia lacustris]